MKMNQLIPMLPVSNISVSVEFYQKLGRRLEQFRGQSPRGNITAKPQKQ